MSSSSGLTCSELRLRFSEASFTDLRCSRDVPLCVKVHCKYPGDDASLLGPPVRAAAYRLNVEPRDLGSITYEWAEPSKSVPPLNWVGGCSEVDKILVFAAQSTSFAEMEFRMDFYESTCQPRSHVGLAKFRPLDSLLKDETCGSVVLGVKSESGADVGHVSISCLLIKPLPRPLQPAPSSTPSWLLGKKTLLGGHRGMGDSHHKDPRVRTSITENTVASLNHAGRNGADFVEFDVQLTHDHVPIVYHNFAVAVKSETSGKVWRVLIKDLTLADLRRLKLFHVSELGVPKRSIPLVDFSDISEPLAMADVAEANKSVEERIFPTLEEVMSLVSPELMMDLEVKYPVPEQGNNDYDFPFLDRGVMADAILKVVLPHSGNRNMFFSCFDADMCTVLRLKQSHVPVFFLSTNCCPEFDSAVDPRSRTVQAVVGHARIQDLTGIVVESYQLLDSDAEILVKGVQSQKLLLYTWGNNNNWVESRITQTKLGVNGIIHDRFGEQLNDKQ